MTTKLKQAATHIREKMDENAICKAVRILRMAPKRTSVGLYTALRRDMPEISKDEAGALVLAWQAYII